jgi:uncharacterized membrane protein
MALSSLQTTHLAATQPAVRKIGLRDIADAILAGIEDFAAKPTHLYFLGVIYPLVTLGAFLVVFNYDLLPLAFPVISGSLLIGPFLTIAMCEISRRRERGEDISSPSAGNFLRNPAAREILLLGAVLLALFTFWLTTAWTIYGLTLGDPWQTVSPRSAEEFATRLFTTPEGWTLIAVGNVVGLFFAITALCISVVSFPLLVDRHVSIGTAITTSIRAVQANPVMTVIWGFLVALALVIGAVPFLVGLAVCVPVLGHATWHLYRRLVV